MSFELKVDQGAFLRCMRRATDRWLAKTGGGRRASVTSDGTTATVSVFEDDSGSSVARTYSFLPGTKTIPVLRRTGDKRDEAFDPLLVSLIQEELSLADDLIGGKADPL